MLLPWQTATVKRITEQNSHTRSYFLEVHPGFQFVPGQFVTLDLPIHPRPSQRLRSYSIASAPENDNTFELLISIKKGGSGTTYIFNEVAEGNEITFRGPLGTFILPDAIHKDICMICTGTGVAPFRSQIIDLLRGGFTQYNLHLVFGARFMEDLLYYDELRALELQYSNFHYHPVLSRETSPKWTGARGYVHPVYTSICDNGKKEMDFYLCGWKNMIDETRQNLEAMGYPKDSVHLELYD